MAANETHDPEAVLAGLRGRWMAGKAKRPLYRVRDWMALFETSQTRKYKRLYSVNLPNKHDGKGYGRLCRHPHSLEVFGAFVLIVELASKAPARGYLCDEDGPWDAEDMAEMSRMPLAPFEWALEALVGEKIDWIEIAPSIAPVTGDSTGNSQQRARAVRTAGNLPDSRTIPPALSDSHSSAPIMGDSHSIAPVVGEFPHRIGLDRIGSTHTVCVPASVPDAGASSKASTVAPPDLEASVQGVFAKLCALDWFGKGPQKKRRPGYDQARALGELIAAGVPIEEKDWEALAWLYRRPWDESDIELRQRRRTPERLALHLIPEIERALQLCGELGIQPGASAGASTEKKSGPDRQRAIPAPAGWQKIYRKKYGEDPTLPWDELPPAEQAELEKGAAA